MTTDPAPGWPLDEPSKGGRTYLKWLFRANWAGVDDSDPVAMRTFVQACRERDRRVGALLRELHYLCTSKPPWGLKGTDEGEYWTGYAGNCPTLSEATLQAEIDRRKAGR